MPELKPCPFCGGEARISNTEITRYNAGRTEKIKIECSVCDAKIEATRHERTAAYTSMNGTVIIVGTGVFDGLGAIEQWNRRASDGMGIVYESQIHCECDKCGEILMSSIVTLKQSKALLREKGWSIGKHVFCPKCKGKEEGKR